MSSPEQRICITCSGPLTGRQVKYCSNLCKYERKVKDREDLLNSNEKVCVDCGETKTLAEFYSIPSGWRVECKLCTVERNKNRSDAYIKKRKAHVKATYNLDWDVYQSLEEFQGFVCAVCGKPPSRRALSVDHNHATGQVRGLLCMNCNAYLIGKHNDAEIFLRAYEYLSNPPLVQAGYVVYTKAGPTRSRRRRTAIKRNPRKK